jgi:peptidoglycan/LPS O-acetylase OafA/YrhL
MIQRIQSIYLLLASGAFGSLFALPLLTTPATDKATAVAQMADGQLNLHDNTGLLGLACMGTVLALAAIFLFKNRPLQGKMAGSGILVGILLLVLAAAAVQGVRSSVPADGSVQFGVGLAAPVLGTLLLFLANRAIQKDEKLVRSMDRLR